MIGHSQRQQNVDSSLIQHQQPSVAPELFHLIERGEWKKVAERCKTNPKEARVWVHLKKSSSSINGTGYDSSGTAADDNMDYTVGNDSSANRSIGTITSTKSNGSAGSATGRSIKCQALHHACQRLRSVHGRIQRTLSYIEDSLSDTPPSMSPNNILRARARTGSSDIDVFKFIQTSPINLRTSSEVLNSHIDLQRTQQNQSSLFDFVSNPASNPPFVFIFNDSASDTLPMHEDPWIEACKAILALIEAHPEAVEMRETRHGCLPLHLAVFSMCPTPMPSQATLSRGSTAFTSQNSHVSSNVTVTGTSKTSNVLLPRRRKGMSLDLSTQQPPTSPSTSISTTNTKLWLDRIGRRTKSLPCVSVYPDSPSGLNHDTTEDHTDESLHPLPLRRYVSDPIDERDHLNHAIESPKVPLHAMNDILSTPDKNVHFPISSNSVKGGGSSAASISSSSYNNNHNNIPASPSPFHVHPLTTVSSLRSRSNSISTTNYIHSSTNLTEKVLSHFYLSQYIADAQLREEYSMRVLNALLEAYPKSIRIDSEGSRLPLHTAVAGRAILPVIRSLIAAYPDAARHRNKEGYLPLHLAAHWGVSSPLVAPFLLMAYPDACLGKNRWERTPLEEALAIAGENGRMHQIPLVRALRRHPSYWTRALHQTSQRGCNTNREIDYLVKVFEDLFQEEEGYHNIEDNNTLTSQMEEIVSIQVPSLSENQPELSNQRREDDPTNLIKEKEKSTFLSSDEDSSIDVIIKKRLWKQLLMRIQQDPTGVSILRKIPVRAGYTARVSLLYLACERNPPLNVIQTLVSICPVATVTRKDPGGQLPLHAACTWGASFDVFSFLLGIHPLSSTQMDDLGNLPLHCACFSGCSDEIVDALLQAFPRSVMLRNVHGSVPSDIVRRLRHVNKHSILSLIEKVELDILLRPRSMSLEMDVVIVPKPHSIPHEHDQETISDTGMKDIQPMLFVENDEELVGVNDEVDEDGRLWV